MRDSEARSQIPRPFLCLTTPKCTQKINSQTFLIVKNGQSRPPRTTSAARGGYPPSGYQQTTFRPPSCHDAQTSTSLSSRKTSAIFWPSRRILNKVLSNNKKGEIIDKRTQLNDKQWQIPTRTGTKYVMYQHCPIRTGLYPIAPHLPSERSKLNIY